MGGAAGDQTLPSGRDARATDDQRFAIGSIAQDRYRIERFIAAGGMGEVYAARDLVLDTTVALKTLRPELEGSADAVARLRREIALARSVTDPHICRLHDVGEHRGRVFLSMELLEGRTLAELVGRHPPALDQRLGLDEVERLARQLVAGLSALHRASIIHRDFKTSNVIVVGDGDGARAVITDFGLARSIDATDARITIESGLLGTPAYMAPEQVEARPATKASDIYALGVVLFELLTGKLPFDEDTAMATATARLTKDPPRPSALRGDIPPRWDAIVLRCLARDPAARFASVDDVLGHQPRSRRWFVAASGGSVAAVALGLWRLRDRLAEPARPAVARSPDDLVAVLPVTGEGSWLTDAWRSAISFDLHDALATVGVPLLYMHSGGMDLSAHGAAARLAAEPDPAAAARALPGVTNVVTASLARSSAELALTVVLDGTRSWQRTFRRPLAQAALVAYDAAVAVAMSLGFAVPRLPLDAATFDVNLYRRYGEALASAYRRRTPEEIEAIQGNRADKPLALLDRLVEDHPELVRAVAVAADFAVMRAEQVEDFEAMRPMLDRVDALAGRALATDPDNALARAVRGHTAMLRWDWQVADEETRHALERAPTHERVLYHRSFLLMMTARFDEILPTIERAHARNTTSPTGAATIAWQYYYARRWPDVVRVVEPVADRLAIDKFADAMTLSILALAYVEMGRPKDALRVADQLHGAANDYVLAGVVPVYALAGRPDVARALRDRIGTSVDLALQAIMADGLGDLEHALVLLEQVVASRNVHALFLQVERFSPQLKVHPRFHALLKTVGFP